ncbi:MAG TPA: hypothetical protein VD704_04455 [Gaiellaceae bacterium]|nr:hypothetical protein [Gaiellaceae bacterium]
MATYLRRTVALASLALRDTARAASPPPPGGEPPEGALEAAIRWLVRTHEATGRRGSSKGFSLLHGWLPPYPETTGYIVGTLLDHAARTGDDALREHARQMGEWEIEVQNADGGVMEGAYRSPPSKSIVFNTGMVVFGWLDLHAELGDERYLEAAVRAGRWLADTQREDGTWGPGQEHHEIPHTYNSRVDWALVRLADATGDERLRETAVRNLDWVLSTQQPNGWHEWCIFRPGTIPNSHGLAYTMRGLLESAVLLGEPRYLEAAVRTARPLLEAYRRLGKLPARFGRDWSPAARSICVTGLAQTGGVWLRLFQETGEEAFRSAGADAVAQAARLQSRSEWADVDGAVPGSFPIYGRYAPLQYPNWAAKFLADSLALRETVLADAS